MQVAQSENNGEKKTVLFVDDEQIVLDVGSLMLQKLGYNVLAVSNGKRAIDILRKNKIAFVLLDMLIAINKSTMDVNRIFFLIRKIVEVVTMYVTCRIPMSIYVDREIAFHKAYVKSSYLIRL